MKRKMVYAGTAWTAGIVSAELFSPVPAVIAAAVIAVLLLKIVPGLNLKSIAFMLTAFYCAFLFYNAYDLFVYRNITDLAGSNISYSGTVKDFRDYSGNKSVYFLDGKINGKTNAKFMLYSDSMTCDPGDTLRFECVPEKPESDVLFDSLGYYKSKGIYLRTDSAENISVLPCSSYFSLRNTLYKFRTKICSVTGRAVPEKEAGMIKGMLFGDKSGIYEDDLTMMYRIGIGHVTAVSGLHLVLFCTLISFAAGKIKAGKITQFIVSEIFMLLFVICCGMSVSVIRAFIMMTLVNLAPVFFRYSDSLNSISIAVILLTLQNPFAITNPSFILSVSGALGAGVFAPYMTANMKADTLLSKLFKNLAFLTCISLAVTPASVICFGEMSIISPLSNLIITPACMTAILTAMIASMLIFTEPVFLFKISGAICRTVINLSRIIGQNPFTHAKLTGEYVPVITTALIIFCIFTYLLFKNRKYELLSVIISAAIFFSSSAYYNMRSSKFVNIALLGKNETGVIIISKGFKADVIDINGKAKNSTYAARYLDSLGISDINSVVIVNSPYSSMSAYNSALSLFNTENVVVPSDTFLMKDTKICGCTPNYSEFSPWSSDYGNYSVSVINDRVNINCSGFHFDYPEKENKEKYPVNSVLRISNNGKYDIRRLENG